MRHHSKALLENIIEEFRGRGPITTQNGVLLAPAFFGSYALLSIMLDYVVAGQDEPTLSMEECLLDDPMLYWIAGPEQVAREATYVHVRQWLGRDLARLMDHVNVRDVLDYMQDGEPLQDLIRDPNINRVIADIERIYKGFTVEEQTVVTYLRNIHQHCLLLAMTLVLDKESTTSDYSEGAIGALMLQSEHFSDVTAEEELTWRAKFLDHAEAARRFLAAAKAA